VPVTGLHANKRGDYVETGLKCTAIAGLRNGLTLVTTNHASMCVIDRLRVVKKYSDLDGVINELAPLDDRSFVAVVQEKQRVDLYVNELDHEEVAGVKIHYMCFVSAVSGHGCCVQCNRLPMHAVVPAHRSPAAVCVACAVSDAQIVT
jgi:hypothetical protein